MKRMLALFAGALASAAIATGALAAVDVDRTGDRVTGNPQQAATLDLVDTAVAAGDFTTLATALEAAGLVETLKGEGPFTVFAPTDAAFAQLPAGALDALLADPGQLKAVLLYHVVPGRVTAADVVGLTEATTVGGGTIAISTAGGGVMLNGTSNVTATDVAASNGVIHVIDTVLIPPAQTASPAPAATGNAGLSTSNGTGAAWIALLAAGAVVLAGGARFAMVRRRR